MKKSNYHYCIDCNRKAVKCRPFKTGRCRNCKVEYRDLIRSKMKCEVCNKKLDHRNKYGLCYLHASGSVRRRQMVSEANKEQYAKGLRKAKFNSKPEKRVKEMLLELDVNFKQQFRIDSKSFDFYLPDQNILIEVDGDYWHANPAKYNKNELDVRQSFIVNNDILKNNLSKNKGYKLVRIWESDIEKSWRFV
jgi:very-short-patch-repair endonuclease